MNGIREIIFPLLEGIRSGKKVGEVSELWGGARALFLLSLFREADRHLLVMTATEEEAEALVDDLRFMATAAGASA